MWKKRILCLALVLCAVLLTACQQKETEVYSETPPTATPTFAPVPATPDTSYTTDQVTPEPQQTTLIPGSSVNYDETDYNPASEEGGQNEEIYINVTQTATPSPTPIVYSSKYAGATPVPIDPINKPTPTPVPKIEFKDSDYVRYEAAELHLSFEGPIGWILEGPTSWEAGGDSLDTYTLTNPDTSLDYAGQIKIRVVPVNKQYSKSELDKEVKAARDSVRSALGFSKFDTYDIASYNFLKIRDTGSASETPKYKFIDNKGRYTRFKGTLKENGAKVAGRVIVNSYNKSLYILAATYPGGDLQEAFENVYRRVRDSLILDQ